MIKSATVIIALVSTAYGESTDKFQELSYIISTNKLRDENTGLIVVKAEPNFRFSRSWMRDLLCDKTVIPYENNIGNMGYKVCEQIESSKKSLLQRLSCSFFGVRTKTAKSNDFSLNNKSHILESVPGAAFSVVRLDSYARKESPNTNAASNTVPDYTSGVLTATARHTSHSIVSGLFTQTGSAGCSTWV